MLFQQYFVKKSINAEHQELIKTAINCGKDHANDFVALYGKQVNLMDITEKLGINLTIMEQNPITTLTLFGQFTPPNQIVIYQDSVDRVYELLDNFNFKISKKVIFDLVLGHELFHWYEEKNSESIFTRTAKIKLWKVLGWTFYSKSPVLSEIAAMVFTKEINKSFFNPSFLNVVISENVYSL